MAPLRPDRFGGRVVWVERPPEAPGQLQPALSEVWPGVTSCALVRLCVRRDQFAITDVRYCGISTPLAGIADPCLRCYHDDGDGVSLSLLDRS